MGIFRSAASLNDRLQALGEAAEIGGSRLTPAEHAALTRVATAAQERRALSGDHTVVGFFGATGSGKTSLFNAVVGENLGQAAARRPTTSSPLAAIWHPEGSEELLDWLEVEDRRTRPGDFTKKAGPLILLDLPDFDSVEPVHREIATRLAGQVDVLVWVTDPEKYADAIIHDDFIRPHALHSDITLAVLNKSDRLSETDRQTVSRSYAQLLSDDGLRNVTVISTSATTGYGIDELRTAIAQVSAEHTAQQRRIEADIDAATATWAGAKPPKSVPNSAKRALDEALTTAAGADALADVTAAAYRKRLGQKTGWVLTAWMLRLRPDPLRRLGLREEADTSDVHRSSMPTLDAASKAVANRGVREYAARVAEGLPEQWQHAVGDCTEQVVEKLPEELDRVATRTKLPAQPSGVWNIFTLLQWLALLAALVGVGWYLAIAFLPGIITPLLGETIPEVEGWPVPTLLIMAGLLLGIVLGLFTAAFGFAISAVIRSRTRAALRDEVSEVSGTVVEDPLLDIRDDYADFLAKISLARG
ncbi:GTPase family protein [Corynebacterium epidermidicanis]|uniref:Putative GTPase n=1 Tax=Corynebacterium epidermidicanis TaxID=1050174 RepID=A0A0G3GP03_9CORY|nr:GTPase [Corynebacterium epidermidicanis]AKK02280.1 putative GTPase [Corynebacterium epidermidicanis]